MANNKIFDFQVSLESFNEILRQANAQVQAIIDFYKRTAEFVNTYSRDEQMALEGWENEGGGLSGI